MQKKTHYCQRIQKRERSKQHLIARFSMQLQGKRPKNAVEHFLPINKHKTTLFHKKHLVNRINDTTIETCMIKTALVTDNDSVLD